MRKFALKLLLGAFPFVVLFTCMELYCRTQTIFAVKEKFLKRNLGSIEVLILGSSHDQNAINPEFIDAKTCNLAFGGQPISIDYYLLDAFIDKMPKLKTVFLEVATHRFYDDLVPESSHGYIYSILYGIKYKVKTLSLKNYLFIYSDYNFFSSVFFDYCNPWSYKYRLNESGFVMNDYYAKFGLLNYDTGKINKTFVMHHDFSNREDLYINQDFYKRSIQRCVNKGLNVVLIKPPLYKTYSSHVPVGQKKEVDSLVDASVVEYGVRYFDYSSDRRFNVYDFKNDNHLNSSGAEKFSKVVEAEILDGIQKR